MKRKRLFYLTAIAVCIVVCALFSSCREEYEFPDDTPYKNTTIEDALCGVVAVYTDISGGSGMIVGNRDGSDLILTSYHVISDGTPITVAPYGAELERTQADMVWSSETYDLALICAHGLTERFEGLAQVRFTEEIPKTADGVFVIGNFASSGIAVRSAVISRDNEFVTLPTSSGVTALPFIRIGTEISSGTSGGAVVTEDGYVLGIVNSRRTDTSEGYAMGAHLITALIDDVLSGNRADILDLGAEVTEEGGFIENKPYAVTVTSVRPGSPASLFLEKGDILLEISVNGESYPVTRAYLLQSILIRCNSGDEIKVKYERDGKISEYILDVSDAHIKNIN